MMKEKQLELNKNNNVVNYNRTGQIQKQTIPKPKQIAAMTSNFSNATISGQQRNNIQQPPSALTFKKPTVEGM